MVVDHLRLRKEIEEIREPIAQVGTSWKERHEHSAYVFQDKIWVAGGHAQPISSEVWSLEIPKDWFKNQKP